MLFLFSFLALTFLACADPIQFDVDTSHGAGPFPHYWENAVGSGHATLTLRSDWREHMLMGASLLGIKSVRFHAIFDDDMSTFSFYPSSPSFFNIDSSYDYLLSIGVRPLVELSFMPLAWASNDTWVFHYDGNTSPPRDYAVWAQGVTAFAQHLIARYGLAEVSQWLFEVWNEPNIDFWSGTQQQYFDLYNVTALALKSVSPQLRVGGPVSSNCSWLPEFVAYVHANQIPIDFVSSHLYPTDRQPLSVDVVPSVVAESAAIAAPLPFYLTEYNDGLGIGQHDLHYAAAFIFRNVITTMGMTDLFSFWCISDIFEEGGQSSMPFSDQFGLITIHGIPKPSFRAFELLHKTGTQQVTVTGPAINSSTVGMVAVTLPSHRGVDLLLWNHAAIQDPCPITNVSISVTGSFLVHKAKATIARIDETHANPQAQWLAMGSPQYLNAGQVKQLMLASMVAEEPVAVKKVSDHTVVLEVSVMSQSAQRIQLTF